MKVTTGLGLVLLLLSMSTAIGCRETAMPFETIDAIAVLERADLHGQLGHLIQVESTPTNGRGEGTTVVYAKVFDKDISDAPYYLQWRHTPVRAGDYLSTIADILGRAENLALVTELPKGASLYEEVVIGKPNTIAERVTHCLEVTTADGVFYLGVHIVFTDTVKAWFATKLSQPLRMFFLEEKEGEPLTQLLLSLLPDVVRTAINKDDDGTLTVSLQKEVVAATPVSENEETLTLAAYRKDVLEPPPPTAEPPTITMLSAVSDNTDTTQAVTGDIVTLTLTTNKPIVLQRSRLTFTTENGTYNRVIQAVSGVDNRYTSQLRITDAMATGTLSVSVTLVDDDDNTSGTIVRDTMVAIADYELFTWQERYQDVDDWAVMRPPEEVSQPSVRLIYFLPNDRPVRSDRAVALCQMITEVQEFYADEMQRHGFGRKTFPIETDADGVPVVHYIEGQFDEDHYYRSVNAADEQCRAHFDDPRHVYFIAIDLSYETIHEGRHCGVAGRESDHSFLSGVLDGVKYRVTLFEGYGGSLLMPVSGHCFFDDVHTHHHEWRVPIHELGHTFGLKHDLREGTDATNAVGGRGFHLTHCDAEWLSVSRFFNDRPFSAGSPGDVSLLSTPTQTPEGLKLRFRVADADGLHYAQLIAREEGSASRTEILACKPLSGVTDTIEFISPVFIERPPDAIRIQMIDVTGGTTFFSLFFY